VDEKNLFGTEEVPKRLWQTWKKCRKRIFHFFPQLKQVISLEEAEERLLQIFETMEFVILCFVNNFGFVFCEQFWYKIGFMKSIAREFKEQEKRRILLIISGPTCAGKDVVMRKLLKRNKDMVRLVTTNSRPKRKGERQGVDYYFVTKKEFEKLIAKGAFYEWVEYRGHYRGGQKKHVKEALDSGKDVVWRIDVRGVKNIYKKVKKEVPNSVFVFLAEELPVLEERMKKRATEDKKGIIWSKNRAKWELRQFGNYDYVVRNKQGQLKKTVEAIEQIIESERRKVKK